MIFSIQRALGAKGARRCLGTSLILTFLSVTHAACPWANLDGAQDSPLNPHRKEWAATGEKYLRQLNENRDWGIPDGGYSAVTDDIIALLTDSKDFWPADFGNYGPFMIRLAWHCAGSYRASDGRGGCDGGRIRHNPELHWDDNANLDKALELLKPVKEKYGSKLSWGDLIVLAGNAAIQSMGGPVLGFCGGRVDDVDGSASLKLGPSEEQEAIAPCVSIGQDGNCTSPLGPTTVELIYVNPTGHMGVPEPSGSVHDLRDSFGRMGMNDAETAALTGGGHAFGKCHGACSSPPCGTGEGAGKGVNTFTSGLEGAWTTSPTKWSNQYFTNLLDYDWTLITGPGGSPQWEPKDSGIPIMMLTADLAFINDPSYKEIVERFANDITALEDEFSKAWYKLMTRDMGPVTRCIGDNIPAVQEFQMPLPTPPETLPDFSTIASDIQDMIKEKSISKDIAHLAYQCASTYRATDHTGGCNGARIRFSPEAEWANNMGTKETLATLSPIKEKYPDLSWSDLIVLAGNIAVESAGGKKMKFCGGRTDASDGKGSEFLAPRKYEPATVSVRDDMEVKGLSARQMVALAGRPSDMGDEMSNNFFKMLLLETEDMAASSRSAKFAAEHFALVKDPEFKAIVQEYADDEEIFLDEFASAWTYIMTADRYAGPTTNACTDVDHLSFMMDDTKSSSVSTSSTFWKFASFGLSSLLFAFISV